MPSVLFSKGLLRALCRPCVLVWGKRWHYCLFWQAADWLLMSSNWGQRGNLDLCLAPISHSSYYRYVIVVKLFLSLCSWNMCEKIKAPMEKYTDCIGTVFSVGFVEKSSFSLSLFCFFPFKAASGMCCYDAKVVSLSLCDLFQISVCLQSWTQPFSVL